jgi:hypothetical protein
MSTKEKVEYSELGILLNDAKRRIESDSSRAVEDLEDEISEWNDPYEPFEGLDEYQIKRTATYFAGFIAATVHAYQDDLTLDTLSIVNEIIDKLLEISCKEKNK